MAKDYLVLTKFYDSSKVDSEILHKEFDRASAEAGGYHGGMTEEREGYDLYVDAFETIELAENWVKEAKTS